MLEKQKKNVPVAEEKTPSQETKREDIEVSLPFEISPKAMRRAKEFGIPLEELLQWVAAVEYRFQVLAKNLEKAPKEFVRLLKVQAQKAREVNVKRMEESGETRQHGGGLTELAGILRQTGLVSGGGGMDEEMMNLNKELLRATIDNAKQNILNSRMTAQTDRNLSQAIKEAITKRIAGKAAADLID